MPLRVTGEHLVGQDDIERDDVRRRQAREVVVQSWLTRVPMESGVNNTSGTSVKGTSKLKTSLLHKRARSKLAITKRP